jgi:hypothetical protein
VGCTHSGDEAPLVKKKKKKKNKKTKQNKTKQITNNEIKNFNLLKPRNNLATIILTKMAPVATHHFSLPFQPPCHPYPDQPNQHLLRLSNRLTAFPTSLPHVSHSQFLIDVYFIDLPEAGCTACQSAGLFWCQRAVLE